MSRADRLAKGIYWDRSLNCFTGCSPVGAGCDNCWAKRTAEGRLRGRCGYPADEPFRPTFHPERLSQVNSKQKPQVIALCFMSDPFHRGHDIGAKFRMLDKVVECRQHTFIALTKRAEEMRDVLFAQTYASNENPIPNLVGGVSVWDQESADRMIPLLLETNLATRIVSLEPCLGAVDFPEYWFPKTNKGGLQDDGSYKIPSKRIGIDGVILGGESGPGARPMQLAWARDVKNQCEAAGVPLFIKQLHINGRISHKMEEWPVDLRIRELPEVMS